MESSPTDHEFVASLKINPNHVWRGGNELCKVEVKITFVRTIRNNTALTKTISLQITKFSIYKNYQ